MNVSKPMIGEGNTVRSKVMALILAGVLTTSVVPVQAFAELNKDDDTNTEARITQVENENEDEGEGETNQGIVTLSLSEETPDKTDGNTTDNGSGDNTDGNKEGNTEGGTGGTENGGDEEQPGNNNGGESGNPEPTPGEGDEGENQKPEKVEPKLVSEVEGITATWDIEHAAITITGHSTLTRGILNQFTFTDENGDVIAWKTAFTKLTVQGDKEGLLVLEPWVAGEGTMPFANPGANTNVIGSPDGFSLVAENVASIPRDSFFHQPNLTSCTLTTVGDVELSAFFDCPNLQSVFISTDGAIGNNVFMGCTNLESATISADGVIGDYVFAGCTNLDTLTINKSSSIGKAVNKYSSYEACNNLKTLNISNVDTIPGNVFAGLPELQTVTLSNIDTIASNAFKYCAKINKLSFTDIVTIGASAFEGCTNLPEVSLDGVDLIGKRAFYGCNHLLTATISNVIKVDEYAFGACTRLKTLNLTNVDELGNRAFWCCYLLDSVNSLENVNKRIGGFAFYGCSNLKDLFKDLIEKNPNFSQKLGYNDVYGDIMERIERILRGKFKLEDATDITAINGVEGYQDETVNRDVLWNTYENGTQVVQQARWVPGTNDTEAEVRIDAYFTAEKQMDYIFVADLSASMAWFGNENDNNARFYDMQSKLLDMVSNLMTSDGYDCKISIVTFGGYVNDANPGTVASETFENVDQALAYIKTRKPLNENTDYGLGLNAALKIAQANSGRHTSVVFLSDGRPTYDGKNSLGTVASLKENDAKIANLATQITATGAEIYGVLHSPTTTEEPWAKNAMTALCGEEGVGYWTSSDTETFGKAMNAAFTANNPTFTLTIPVGDDFENVQNIEVSESAGSAKYDEESNSVIWTLSGMPFTKHTLTFHETLKAESQARTGSNINFLNNGAGSNGDGATISFVKDDPDNPIVRLIRSTVLSRTNLPPELRPEEPENQGQQGQQTGQGQQGAQGGQGDQGQQTQQGGATGAGIPAIPAVPVPVAVVPAPAAPAAPVTIDDNDNPMAAPEEIDENANPLGAFDEPVCPSHTTMFLGIFLTLIYGIGVVIRRLGYANDIEKMDKSISGSQRAVSSEARTREQTQNI